MTHTIVETLMKINWNSGAVSGALGGLISGLGLAVVVSLLIWPVESRKEADQPVAKIGATRVYELRLEDSTRCVVAKNPDGVAISCNWK